MNVVIVIPAYQPDERLAALVRRLSATPVRAIIVVDDGSSPERAQHFEALRGVPKTRLLRHAVNLGKGAALRTGLNCACCDYAPLAGVVTADADGQHEVDDILTVGRTLERNPGALVMGCRKFDHDVPLRSRVGNRITATAVRALVGKRLTDTQTGLRGIPPSLALHLLRMTSAGYEFELDMLIACKHLGVDIVEQPIATIYLDGNRSSHFNPLFDSMRIYFTLLRFSAVSLLTALVDNGVFWVVLQGVPHIAAAQLVGRTAGVAFNYGAVRRAVFLSDRGHAEVLPRYLGLVAVSGAVSYGLIQVLLQYSSLGVMPAKMLAESLIFIANFALQRDFVFTRRESKVPRRTDWDRYYSVRPAFTARLTRRYTRRRLVEVLRRWTGRAEGARIVELGGADSCFVDRLLEKLRPAEYHAVDNNRLGLDLLARRHEEDARVHLHGADILSRPRLPLSDVVFSVGLVEHFDEADTARAVAAHFEAARPGGTVLITFPTPTLLYRLARAGLELIGQWRFFDERPLGRAEVLALSDEHGELLAEETLWPIVLTQHLMVFRKRAQETGAREDAAEGGRASG